MIANLKRPSNLRLIFSGILTLGWLLPLNLTCSVAFAGTASGTGALIRPIEGLPLPWPFPWAKECPVNWQAMQGRYLLSDSGAGAQIDLQITIVDKLSFKLIRVSRYDDNGHVISDGFTFVSDAQKTIRLWLMPADKTEPPTWAILKLYYGTAALRCADDQLIPILTLDQPAKPNHVQSQYRLMKH